MKLSLGILLEEIVKVPVHIFGKHTDALILRDIRRLPQDAPHCEEDILYCDGWEIIDPYRSLQPKYLLCIGNEPSSVKYYMESGIDGAIFETSNHGGLIRQLQEVFMKYSQLEYALMDAIIHQKTTKELLDLCAEFFGGHVSLFNNDLHLIAASNLYLPRFLLNASGSAPELSFLASFLCGEIRQLEQTASINSITNAELFTKQCSFENVIIRPIYLWSKRIGVIMVAETGKPLSGKHTELLDYVSNILESTLIQRYGNVEDPKEDVRRMFLKMQNEGDIERFALANTLQRINWKPDDDYRILTINIPALYYDNRNAYLYMREYEALYPDCIGFVNNDNIILIIHNDEKNLIHSTYQKLEPLLETHNAVCGFSFPFSSILQLNNQYLVSKESMKNLREGSRIGNLLFDRYVFSYLTSLLSPVPFLFNRSIQKIQEYDANNGTDLLRTLEYYLKCDRSLKETASRLFIHRNTLVYRLRCIEQIAPVDYDDPQEKLHALISCILLRYSQAEESEATPENTKKLTQK